MKRCKECGDGSLTVSYGIRCQLDQLIRNSFLSRAWISFKGREAAFVFPYRVDRRHESAYSFVPYGALWATIASLNFAVFLLKV